jgi:hypothetical protein
LFQTNFQGFRISAARQVPFFPFQFRASIFERSEATQIAHFLPQRIRSISNFSPVLTDLSLRHFRCFETLDCQFAPELNAVR